MKIEIYNFGQLGTRKLVGYIYLGLVIIAVGSMINGPVGSGSFFVRYNAPLWLYVVTTILAFVCFLLYLNSLSSRLIPLGLIEFGEDEILVNNGKNKETISYSDVKELKVEFDYRFDDIETDKKNQKLNIACIGYQSSFDVILSPSDKIKLEEFFKLKCTPAGPSRNEIK